MFTGNYILAPRGGFHAGVESQGQSALHNVLQEARQLEGPQLASFGSLNNVVMSVLDTTTETTADGPLLVRTSPEAVAAVNSAAGPLRFFPEVIYDSPIQPLQAIPMANSLAAVQVMCVDAASGKVAPNQKVVAFTDFANKVGASSVTDAHGIAHVKLQTDRIEKLFVLPGTGSWGAYRENLVGPAHAISLFEVTPATLDVIRRIYPATRFNRATGVTVGVLDSGCGPHAELNVTQGRCTVTGEPESAWPDIAQHGTHVAGLIGGKGVSGPALRGMAPGVNIRAYRVFRYYGDKLGASNYAVLKAMIMAAVDGCDIINLSLGGGPHDVIVEEAIRDAGMQGMLTVVAAGNDGRKAVAYPAAYSGAMAVSAMGDENYLPPGCYDRGAVFRPPSSGMAPGAFIARFSNVGPQISVTGLGVGVTSTLPGNQLGIMSGTSMAAPMIAGCAASLLSTDATIFGMPRDQARAQAITRLVTASCAKVFKDLHHEGFGLPDPALV
jgi:subtilisin family serine protease